MSFRLVVVVIISCFPTGSDESIVHDFAVVVLLRGIVQLLEFRVAVEFRHVLIIFALVRQIVQVHSVVFYHLSCGSIFSEWCASNSELIYIFHVGM